MLLRAAIPVGYMPAASGSGLLFAMCPSAVPADLLAAISASDGVGEHRAGHHMAHHGATAESDTPSQHFDASHCPVGQILSATAIVAPEIAISLPKVSGSWRVTASRTPGSATPVHSHSRDPPA